jgi:type II secretory pathway pseudopilin PulG
MKTKPTLINRRTAFTLVEVIVMIVIIALLALFYLPTVTTHSHVPARRINCMNNLKQIGTAYRLWANDNGDVWPSQQTVASHGWADYLTNANLGPMCWTNYAIMADDLGQEPRLVLCSSDERQAASSFTNQFNNLNVSYFVGVSANDLYPQSIAAGDRNLGSGLISSNDFGYSPKTGKGNDVAVPTNSSKYPVSWSLKMHSGGNTAVAGNILLGDGSGQQVNTASFNGVWLPNADPTTNWPAGHFPATSSIRLVFP